MNYCVDYLSFTVPFSTISVRNSHLLGVVTESAVQDYLGDSINAVLDSQPFNVLHGRAPYAASWGREDGGVRFFSAPQISHVLVEITGTGCKTLRAHNALESILTVVQDRVSRLDLAVDIITDVKPATFAAKRDVERFKAIGDIRSETGETYYVGSLKSERFARVYRYAEPHPRAATLRVEHVFRREAAKVVAREILASGYNAVIAGAGGIYGWTHEVWTPESTEPASLKVGRMKREDKSTVRWLYGAVIQGVIKAVKRGDLDFEEWVQNMRTEVAVKTDLNGKVK